MCETPKTETPARERSRMARRHVPLGGDRCRSCGGEAEGRPLAEKPHHTQRMGNDGPWFLPQSDARCSKCGRPACIEGEAEVEVEWHHGNCRCDRCRAWRSSRTGR